MTSPRRRYRSASWLAALIGLALLPCLASAQTAPPANRPEEEPGRAAQGASQAGSAAAASEALLGPAGPPVTYDEVSAHPDDIDLNYRFAVQQARAGDVRGAATTLERILLVDPNLPKVRLLYAIVLFRLDSLKEAKREFDAVRQLPVDDEVKSEIDRYLGQIAQREKLSRFSASLTLGGDFNTNRDFAPRSEERLFHDVPTPSAGGRHDFGRIAIGTLEAHRDLQTDERDELLFRSTLYYDSQALVETQDLKAGLFEAGGVMRRDYATFTPTLTFTEVKLDNHNFLQSPGAKLLIERKLRRDLDGYILLQADHQHFFDDPIAVTSGSQSGWRWSTLAGVTYTLNPRMQVGGSFRHTITRAIQGFDAYNTNEIAANYSWLLGHGQFLLADAAWGVDQYDAADFNDLSANGNDISATRRRDGIARATLTYGTPLDTIAAAIGKGPLPEQLRDIVLTLSLGGTWAQSTVTNFAYTNYKAEMLFTKRWEF